MSRKEVIDEWFFPVKKTGEIIVPAPSEALAQRDKLKKEWLLPHPHLPYEVPRVDLGPMSKDGQPGYYVRTVIIYQSPPENSQK